MMRTNKSFHWKRTEYKMLGWLESPVRARARRTRWPRRCGRRPVRRADALLRGLV